jgi:serine/threonine-protein kinase
VATAKLASTPSEAASTVRSCARCAAVYRSDFERCPNDGGALVVAADPLIGRTLADTYVIEALIGEGAMGRVYRAHHKTLVNQRYALKVLLGDLAASATMRTRFAREAASASKLDHPNVVNVIDYGKIDLSGQTEEVTRGSGLHYLVMDLVQGCSLGSIVSRGPMSADRVIRIAHQLCEGLDHAHGRGVIHRDFKSDNILIVPDGGSEDGPIHLVRGGRETARIADFGLAMSSPNEVRLTVSGVACTPAYAAPEQLTGKPIDHRVDLYGLGVTMFEMLSGGYLPFEGDLDACIASKLSREAPSILTRAPNVPPGLVTIVSRLLAHDPDHRPRSARAVIRALETSMTLKMPAIRMIELLEARPPRRSLWIKAAVLGVAIAAAAAAARYADDDVRVPQASVSTLRG